MNDPLIYSSTEHHINPELIADEAKIVLRELHRSGFKAYLVGGGVRDLCLGKKPKDFDIATDASPEQIKPLFRHCLLIGRRFRLAHVRFKQMTIEVATFRTGDMESDDLIIHDNTWGTPHEDAKRRDFTLNGLFYDINDETIIDYVGGFKDLQERCLRTIGDPQVRFRQDPVRMIRLLKFQARYLELFIESETRQALQICRDEITKSSPARLLEEILRMLESGHASDFFRIMFEQGLLEPLIPHLEEKFDEGHHRLAEYLAACDKMHQSPHKPSRDVLLASLIFSLIEPAIDAYMDHHKHWPRAHDLSCMAYDEIDALTGALRHLPKRMRAAVSSIIAMQARLTDMNSDLRRRQRIIEHPDFFEALHFLELRALIDEDLEPRAERWQQWAHEHREARSEHGTFESHENLNPAEGTDEPRSRRRRLPRSRKRSFNEETASDQISSSESSEPPLKMLLPPPIRLISFGDESLLS